jgi:hypothetical protein
MCAMDRLRAIQIDFLHGTLPVMFGRRNEREGRRDGRYSRSIGKSHGKEGSGSVRGILRYRNPRSLTFGFVATSPQINLVHYPSGSAQSRMQGFSIVPLAFILLFCYGPDQGIAVD